MSEQPCGTTGEACKVGGTYVSEAGAKQYFAEGERFGLCPKNAHETRWQQIGRAHV